jgi:arsenite-transporting ATPase
VKLLEAFAHDVFRDQDPTDVFFREKPLEVKKEGGSYALYLRLPFAEKEKIEVLTHGEELIVTVDNQRRHLLLPRSLASRKLVGAQFEGQRLRVGSERRRRWRSVRPAAWSRRCSRRRGSIDRRRARSSVRSSRA